MVLRKVRFGALSFQKIGNLAHLTKLTMEE